MTTSVSFRPCSVFRPTPSPFSRVGNAALRADRPAPGVDCPARSHAISLGGRCSHDPGHVHSGAASTAHADLRLHRCLRGIACGKSIEREAFIARLLRLGYRRGSVVENPGEFSVRGGILDVYSTAYDEPLRIELLGDTIESIRRFDPTTQKSTGKMPQALLLPARELLYPKIGWKRSKRFHPTPSGAGRTSILRWTRF